jgi:hypothetical protein
VGGCGLEAAVFADDVGHAVHGGGHKGGEGDDAGAGAEGFVRESLGRDVAAEVDHFEARRIEKDLDEILADVVGVALDDADDDLGARAPGVDAGGGRG